MVGAKGAPDADWLLFVNLNSALTLSSTEGHHWSMTLINRMVDRRLWGTFRTVPRQWSQLLRAG